MVFVEQRIYYFLHDILGWDEYIPVWLRNRLISAELELVLSPAEKSCVALYYRQFITNINNNHRSILVGNNF